MPALLALLLAVASAAPATATLKAEDGQAIVARSGGAGEDCAVLVHGDQRSAQDWDRLIGLLSERGFRVLAPDLRGHGATGGALEEASYASMPLDVRAAVAHLTAKGCRKLALVGADVGAVLALQAAAAEPGVTNLVLLSPRLGGHGLKVTEALAGYSNRPVLLVSAKDDGSGARATSAMSERFTGTRQVIWVEGAAVGPNLFNDLATLEASLLAWLISDGRGDTVQASRAAAPRTADQGDIETTGKRIGEE
jgi:pimeloyl-ACP methyl ester carboxylesterase